MVRLCQFNVSSDEVAELWWGRGGGGQSADAFFF